MNQPTAEQIAERAFDLGLVDERQLQELWGLLGSHHVDPDEFVQLMVRREMATNYQLDRLLKGERTGFFFGDYKVLYLVGTGTFARVYRAVHRQTGNIVAVKVLRKRYSEIPQHARQFVREGLLGKSLRHKNIVPIYEVVSEGNTHFLVMEFVEGRNLRQFIKIRGKIEPREALRLMIDVTAGLKYAFARALTHRDLKTSNVLVSSHGTAKLVDFGLAAIDESQVDDAPPDMLNSRTIDYAALERATGVRRDDSRSDIYFLGCIFYHMLTGEPALNETRDRMQRLTRTRFFDVVPIQKADPSIPACVSIVVNKALMFDPERRYQTPAAVLSDLRAAAKRLDDEAGAEGRDDAAAPKAAPTAEAGAQRSVMVVESSPQMQDIFRTGFKKAGYRVLLTGDPERALARFLQDPATADCVIFNAQEIGQAALECFNRLAESAATESVPAALLLDEGQYGWREQARTAQHRVVVNMPITMKKLRGLLAHLAPPVQA
ncbi:MAG: protein kinase [Pirellulales bacterium]|nr:protein kinase [Pirellulales bacterium]